MVLICFGDVYIALVGLSYYDILVKFYFSTKDGYVLSEVNLLLKMVQSTIVLGVSNPKSSHELFSIGNCEKFWSRGGDGVISLMSLISLILSWLCIRSLILCAYASALFGSKSLLSNTCIDFWSLFSSCCFVYLFRSALNISSHSLGDLIIANSTLRQLRSSAWSFFLSRISFSR